MRMLHLFGRHVASHTGWTPGPWPISSLHEWRWWNAFDCFVVGASVIELISSGLASSSSLNIEYLRFIRIVQIWAGHLLFWQCYSAIPANLGTPCRHASATTPQRKQDENKKTMRFGGGWGLGEGELSRKVAFLGNSMTLTALKVLGGCRRLAEVFQWFLEHDSYLKWSRSAEKFAEPLGIHICWTMLHVRDSTVAARRGEGDIVPSSPEERNCPESSEKLPFEKKLLPTGIIILRNYLEIGNALPYRKNCFQELFGSVIPIKSVMDAWAGIFFLISFFCFGGVFWFCCPPTSSTSSR